MADKTFDPKELLKLIKLSKNEPLPFAFGLGGAKQEDVLVLHKKKTGKQLFQLVKGEDAGVSKGAWGTAALDGKIITFICEKEVPSLKKKLRVLLKAQNLPFKPAVIGEDGIEVPDDEEEVEIEAPVEEAPVEEAPEVEEEETPEEIEKIFSLEQLLILLKLARTRGEALPFTFGLGGAPADHRLVLHRKKKPKQLFTMLRKRFAEIAKGTWGEATVEAKIVTLRCEKPLPSLRRHAMAMFKANKIPLKIRVLGPDGEELETELDEAPEVVTIGEEDRAAASGGGDAALRKQLKQALAGMREAIKAAVPAHPDRRAEILDLAGAAQNGLADDLPAARAAIIALGALLKELGAIGGGGTSTEAPPPARPAQVVESKLSYRKALLGFDAAAKDVQRQIASLESAVAKLPGEADLAVALRGALSEMNDALRDGIDAGLNAVAEGGDGDHATLLKMIKDYRTTVRESELVRHADTAPFASISIGTTLDTALATLEAELAA